MLFRNTISGGAIDQASPAAPVCSDTLSPRTNLAALSASGEASVLSNGSLLLERSLSLLLALCAQVCTLVPNDSRPDVEAIQAALFSSSKEVLKVYHDRDIENPCAVSIVIRYFHAVCFHAVGNARVSWLVMGEAIRLAFEMHIHDESSLASLNPIERQIRRAVYWQLSTGDRSSSILNSRPICFHDLNFEQPPSTIYIQETPLQDQSRHGGSAVFEERLGIGFRLVSSLFSRATEVLMGLKALQQHLARCRSREVVQGFRRAIGEELLHFHTALDHLPDWLSCPWLWHDSTLSTTDFEYQQHGFWIQHVNLQITYPTLKLVMVQKATELGLVDALGYSDDAVLLAIQKTELANEVIVCVRRAPFEAIKVNGEPCVSSIYHSPNDIQPLSSCTGRKTTSGRSYYATDLSKSSQ